MSDPLFYVDSVPDVGGGAVVDGDEGFHAATVRRIRVGERVVVGDGAGTMADCIVERWGKRELSARVLTRRTVPLPRPLITVVQALPKADRSELAIELATEAGVDRFVAWQAARCVARWDGDRVDSGLRRWRAVARSAARQSRRAYIPGVDGVITTASLVGRVAGTRVLALHESATTPLSGIDLTGVESITVVVGPEGGITDAEIGALTDAGAHAVRLGATVLRTSTAAAVAMGALGVLTRRWDV